MLRSPLASLQPAVDQGKVIDMALAIVNETTNEIVGSEGNGLTHSSSQQGTSPGNLEGKERQ